MYFFRHFLHDARPEYTPEEMDRYIEAWSQPGAATGMITTIGLRCGRRPSALRRRSSRSRRPPWSSGGRTMATSAPTSRARSRRRANLDRVERLLGASHWVHQDAAERVTELLIAFFTPSKPAENRTADAQ